MVRILKAAGLLLATLLGLGTQAWAIDAHDDTGAFYIAPMAEYTLLDTRRASRDSTGWDVNFGLDLPANFAVELAVGNGSFTIPNSGAREKLYSYTVDGLYKFLPPTSVFRPFLLAGGGMMRDEIGGHDTYKTNAFAAEAGGGLLTALGSQAGRFRVQLRTEAKYRWEWIDNKPFVPRNPGDVVFGLGVQMTFGGYEPPPAPKTVAYTPPPDSDGDGVTDDIDQCPNTPAGAKVDARGCEFDSDGDGVVDRLDECPNTPQGWPVDAKGCPLDTDGDGVPDAIDKCPNTPKGDKVDSVGCTIKDEIKLQGVNFATGSADIVGDSSFVLNYAVDTLKKYPNLVIEVRGHTDSTGSRALNMRLSQKRAETVMAYLQEHGVTNQMTAKGYGPEHPIADNKTADGRLENRRVVLHIVSGF